MPLVKKNASSCLSDLKLCIGFFLSAVRNFKCVQGTFARTMMCQDFGNLSLAKFIMQNLERKDTSISFFHLSQQTVILQLFQWNNFFPCNETFQPLLLVHNKIHRRFNPLEIDVIQLLHPSHWEIRRGSWLSALCSRKVNYMAFDDESCSVLSG